MQRVLSDSRDTGQLTASHPAQLSPRDQRRRPCGQVLPWSQRPRLALGGSKCNIKAQLTRCYKRAWSVTDLLVLYATASQCQD